MDKNSNAFTVVFATIVCVVLAVCLAAAYNGFKGQIDANAAFDKNRNVLIAMGLYDRSDASITRADLEKLFDERVVGEVLEVKRGEVEETIMRGGEEVKVQVRRVLDVVKTEHAVADLPALRKAESKKPESERAEFVEIYHGLDEDKNVSAWCIPISGYGLWSWLYGFLALESDLNTVRGITFYQHGETAGLGGEVDNIKWQRSWQGKTILDEQGQLVSVVVKKGIVNDAIPAEKKHMVDGLAGATITSNGVTNFLVSDLETYEPYFKKLRKKS